MHQAVQDRMGTHSAALLIGAALHVHIVSAAFYQHAGPCAVPCSSAAPSAPTQGRRHPHSNQPHSHHLCPIRSYQYQMPGGGALAAIGVAGTASICWTFGFPRVFSTGANDNHRSGVDHNLAIFWMYVMQPLLFCTIGTAINFSYIPAVMLPKALLVIAVGEARILCPWTLNDASFTSRQLQTRFPKLVAHHLLAVPLQAPSCASCLQPCPACLPSGGARTSYSSLCRGYQRPLSKVRVGRVVLVFPFLFSIPK